MRFLRPVILFLFLSTVSGQAFTQSEIIKVAEDHVSKGNFLAAYNIYQRVAEKDTLNAVANFGAGICVLNIAMSKKPAVKFLERAIRAGSKDPDAMFYLGVAYHHNLMYDMAESAFKEYLTAEKGTLLAEANKQIEYVNNARKICQSPISVEFKNLGPNINSEFPDYYPMITPDESFIAFTTRRKNNVGARLEFDGFYPSDIWMSRVQEGAFGVATNAGRGVNSNYDEQLVGLSVTADQMFVYSDNIKEYGNIYYSNLSDGTYDKKLMFDQAINSESFESSATVSADHNTLLFSSDRPGGFGGRDLYMTRKLPTGGWAIPQNLGPKINTEFNEDFPYLFHDGMSLYFASEGHTSIGGYDIFKSVWNPEFNTWTNPVNIGYPVNTVDDNMTISFTNDQQHAYISCYRSDSRGNMDIYLVTFLDKDQRQTVYKCKILKKDSQFIVKDAFVAVFDNLTSEEVGNYYPDPNTGSLILTLKPGTYHIVIEAGGFQKYETDLHVKGMSDFKEFQLQDFIVAPR